MRLSSRHPLAATAIVVALVAGCGAGLSSPAVPPGSPVAPTPVIPSPAAGTYWLRVTTTQAIPPINLFEVGPVAVIDGDGRLLVPGAVPAIFPGPLVTPLVARQVSEQGRATILAWASDLGLLAGQDDFTGGASIPGGVVGHIELTVDGRLVTLTGMPDVVASNPSPGSPEAFGELWRRLSALPDALSGDVGPEAPYTPTAYAILVGPAPGPEAGIAADIVDWPLGTPIATFGSPVANATRRCGIVDGADAAILAPVLATANQLTPWVENPTTSATFGLVVRPIVEGENPCAELFGG